MATKTVHFRGANLHICGRAGDPYFDALDLADHANDFYSAALDRLPTDSVVLDIGANLGLTAVMAAQVAVRVYAFEPSPVTVLDLRRTVEANGLQGRVEVLNIGLAEQPGELTFFEDPTSGSASHLITSDTMGRKSNVTVPVCPLDQIVREQNIRRVDLLKIDVEGFEIDVLRGARKTIAAFRPSAIIEFNAFTMVGFRNINPRALLDEIRSTFPYVCRQHGGGIIRIATDADALSFIHDNLVAAGCVDDLYGGFSPL